VPSPAEAGVDAETDDDGDDTVVLIAGRPGPRAAATLEFSVAWKAGTNTTKKLMSEDSPRSRSAVSPSPPSNSSWNGSIAKANLTVEPSEVVGAKSPLKTPTQWKITVPFKDALAHVFSKDHFVFEVHNGSQNASDNVSAQALEKSGAGGVVLQDDEKSLCPAGYAQVQGHVYGGDQFGRGYNLYASSIQECARWCSHTPGCGSFEYNLEKKRCFRNSQTRPTHLTERAAAWVFCRRAPCPSLLTEAACLGPAVEAGYLSTQVSLRPGSYCIWSAGKCQAPMACTFEDCFLPDGGLPGMDLPPSKTLWISRSGLMSTMAKSVMAF